MAELSKLYITFNLSPSSGVKTKTGVVGGLHFRVANATRHSSHSEPALIRCTGIFPSLFITNKAFTLYRATLCARRAIDSLRCTSTMFPLHASHRGFSPL